MMFRKFLFSHILPCLLLAVVVLPKDTKVVSEGIPGMGWTQTGEMNCAYMSAVRQWDAILNHNGWKIKYSMNMAKNRTMSHWEKSGKNITLLVWEKEIGKSGFAWGELTEDKKK